MFSEGVVKQLFVIMSHKLTWLVQSVCMAVCCHIVLLPVTTIEAAETSTETYGTKLLRPITYDILNEAQSLVVLGNTEQAHSLLDALKADYDRLNDYERSQLWSHYGLLYSAVGKYELAIDAYKSLLSQEEKPLALEIESLFRLGQLNYHIEKYASAIDYLNRWLGLNPKPDSGIYILLGHSHYRLKQFDLGIKQVKEALIIAENREQNVKEDWYRLLYILYYEKREINNSISVLESLTKHYPKRRYWLQLAHLYGEAGREQDQLATLNAVYLKGFLSTEAELLSLVQLELVAGIPHRAASILETGLEKKKITKNSSNLMLLATAWTNAKEFEKAIVVMRQAALKSKSSQHYFILGRAYCANEQYNDCIKALHRVIALGGVKRPDLVYLALGHAYTNVDKLLDAESAFEKARRDDRSFRQAVNWLNYLKNERLRRDKLASNDL